MMNLKQWERLSRKYPRRDLNGRYIAYDIEGKPLGEIIYKKGVVLRKRRLLWTQLS
jgi:hypothetical protein